VRDFPPQKEDTMRPHRIGTWVLSLLVAVGMGMLGTPGGVWGQNLSDLLSRGEAQVVAPSPTPRTFGTANSTAHVVGASEFDPLSNTIGWGYGTFGKQGLDTGQMVAWVRLPAGAMVTSIELEGCDTSNAREIQFSLVRVASPAGPGQTLAVGVTGGPETPGCAFFPVTLFNPVVIDNEHNTYATPVVAPSGPSDFTAVTAVRIYYTLQVSPAPAVASFGDVPPGHPFFPFIEALKASGITSGCQTSPPLYCPDQALTRGQMAVFLSTALGLHFAP
jgi:hypothetical protein